MSVAATVNQSICSKQTSEEIMYVSTRTRREKYLISKEELIRPEDIHVEIKNSETQSNLQKADEQEDIDLINTDSAYQRIFLREYNRAQVITLRIMTTKRYEGLEWLRPLKKSSLRNEGSRPEFFSRNSVKIWKRPWICPGFSPRNCKIQKPF